MNNLAEEIFGKDKFDLTKSTTGRESVELQALLMQSMKLEEVYRSVLPKVTSKLIRSLFIILQDDPHVKQPIFMIEIFTEKMHQTQLESFKNHLSLVSGSGSVPAVYDNGSHFVINMKLTFDILKRLNDSNFVLEICGDYTGTVTAVGAASEYRPEEVLHGSSSNSNSKHNRIIHNGSIKGQKNQKEEQEPQQHQMAGSLASTDTKMNLETPNSKDKKNNSNRNNYKTIIYTLTAIAGIAIITGFIISGGTFPNINTQSFLHSSASSLTSADIGRISGQVTGPFGLPAVGASVIAYKQDGLPSSIEKSPGFTTNSIILVNGQYAFSLPSGLYRITVAYPDGKNQLIDNYAVWPGSDTSLDLKY
jgi:hypothetical protein